MIVKKANDIAFPPPYYLALEFTPPDEETAGALYAIRTAEPHEFPQLAGRHEVSLEMGALRYLEEVGSASATEIARELGFPKKRSQVSKFLTNDPRIGRVGFRKLDIGGREALYGLLHPEG